MRRNSGPLAIRPKRIQLSRAATGQVWLEAATDLDLAPASLAAQRHQHTLGNNLDPATAVAAIVPDDVEPDDLGAS